MGLSGFPATVLAPTDAAVLAGLTALNVSLAALLSNSMLLGNLVRQHVIPVPFSLSQLAQPRQLPLSSLLRNATLSTHWRMLPGTSSVQVPGAVLNGVGSLTIGNARSNATVAVPNIQACNSVIHVLDRMLLPPLPNSPPSAHQSISGAQPDNTTLALLNVFNSGQALRSAPTPALGCCSTAPATTLLVTSTGSLTPSQHGLATLLTEVAAASATPLDQCKTLPQVLESIAELSVLSSIITTTGLSSDFSNTFLQATLFAPSNEALLRVFPQATLDQLLADAADATSPLQALVLLHSVPSPVFSSDMTDGLRLPTFLTSATQLQDGVGLLGVHLVNSTLSGVLVESAGSTAAIAVPDIPACESVIHMVDALLLPQPPNNVTFQASYQSVLASLPQANANPLTAGAASQQGLPSDGSQSQGATADAAPAMQPPSKTPQPSAGKIPPGKRQAPPKGGR